MAHSRNPSAWLEQYTSSEGVRKWRVRLEKDGVRLPSISCGLSKAHAQEVLARELAKLWARHLQIKPAPAEQMRLKRWAAEYLAQRRPSMAQRTVEIDAQALRTFIDFAGDLPIAQVGADVIKAYKAKLFTMTWTRKPGGEARLRQQNGIRILLRHLRTALRRAYKDGLIERDPFLGVEMPAEIPVANPPTPEQMKAMWAELKPIARRAFTVFVLCGLRRSELLSLTKENVLPPIHPGAPWVLHVRKAKTRRGKIEYKTMALLPRALVALQPIPTRGPIFKVGARRLQFLLQLARKRAGLGRIRWHDLRHRWATELMSAVKDEYAVMQVGGWTSRHSVARYQHPTEQRRDATLQLNIEVPPGLPQDAGRPGRRGGRSPS